MPDASGRFRGITVPDLPWLRPSAQAGRDDFADGLGLGVDGLSEEEYARIEREGIKLDSLLCPECPDPGTCAAEGECQGRAEPPAAEAEWDDPEAPEDPGDWLEAAWRAETGSRDPQGPPLGWRPKRRTDAEC